MASTLFNKSTTFNLNVHDQKSDPWTGYFQYCLQQKEYILWNTMIDNDVKYENTEQDKIYLSEFGQNTIKSFEDEGGIWASNKTGKELQYLYCRGQTLPLSNNTFWNAVKYSYQWESAQNNNNSYWLDTDECISHFHSIPMLYKILKDINVMRDNNNNNNNNNNEYPQLLMHSTHDGTLIMLLKSLKMWNQELIIFGELIILEIYTSETNENKYLFRWTKKGKFLPYPLCDYKDDTELCDLDIMLNNSFNDVVDINTYNNDICANLVTNCQCGYCLTTSSTTNKPDNGNNNINNNSFDIRNINFWIGFFMAIFIICIIAVIYKFVYKRYIDNKFKNRNGIYTLSLND